MFSGLNLPVQPLIDVALDTINSVSPLAYLWIGTSFGLFVIAGLIKVFSNR